MGYVCPRPRVSGHVDHKPRTTAAGPWGMWATNPYRPGHMYHKPQKWPHRPAGPAAAGHTVNVAVTNRARYNAEAVVAAFTARLRGTVDLDVVQGDLVDAVHHTFEPAHVSVWLASAGQHQATPLGTAAWQGSP
jgi:hypothetical protein